MAVWCLQCRISEFLYCNSLKLSNYLMLSTGWEERTYYDFMSTVLSENVHSGSFVPHLLCYSLFPKLIKFICFTSTQNTTYWQSEKISLKFFFSNFIKKTKQNCNLTTHRLCHKTPKWVESWCTGQMFLWLDWTPPVVKLLGHEAMMSKELSVDLRDWILLRHRSGERYRKISAVFKFPMSTTVSIIRKRKNCGSTPANLI